MAGQDEPHVEDKSDVSSDAIDMQVAENPTSWDKGNDAALDGDTDGAQTAGKRAFYANQNSKLPQEVSEGTADIGTEGTTLPSGAGHGITNAAADQERATQEKVVGK